jgi:multiple sugar transport system permease protein
MGMLNTYTGLILPQVAGAYGVFLFRQYFLNFPSSLDDAAKIDGLTTFQRYTRIYVPLGKPIFATLAVMKATLVWNDYTWPLILTRTENMRTVQLALSVFRSDEGTNWPYLMCATALISLPLIIAFIFAQKYFIEGIASTGMK